MLDFLILLWACLPNVVVMECKCQLWFSLGLLCECNSIHHSTKYGLVILWLTMYVIFVLLMRVNCSRTSCWEINYRTLVCNTCIFHFMSLCDAYVSMWIEICGQIARANDSDQTCGESTSTFISRKGLWRGNLLWCLSII